MGLIPLILAVLWHTILLRVSWALLLAYSTSLFVHPNGFIEPCGWGTLKLCFLAVLQLSFLPRLLWQVPCGTAMQQLLSNCLDRPAISGIATISNRKLIAAYKLASLKDKAYQTLGHKSPINWPFMTM